MIIHDPAWPGLMIAGATSWEQMTVLGTVFLFGASVLVFVVGGSWRP